MTKTYSNFVDFTTNYNKWVIDQFNSSLGKNIIEVGLGSGGSFQFLPKNCKYLGVDNNSTVIRLNKKKYSKNFYTKADICTNKFIKISQSFKPNSIICLNVLEHIEKDHKALKNMVNSIPVGSYLNILVPSHMNLYNEIDRLAGHFRRYSKKELLKTIYTNINKNQIEIKKIYFFNSVGGIGWLVNKFFKHSSIDSNSVNYQLLLFDKFFIWISKILQPFTKFFFGQSLIVVLKRLK